jgi:hypothetical protein
MVHPSDNKEVQGVSKDSLQTVGKVSAAKTRTEGTCEVAAALRVVEGTFPGSTVSEVSLSGGHATALRSIARLFGRELVFFAGEFADGSIIPAEGAVVIVGIRNN